MHFIVGFSMQNNSYQESLRVQTPMMYPLSPHKARPVQLLKLENVKQSRKKMMTAANMKSLQMNNSDPSYSIKSSQLLVLHCR